MQNLTFPMENTGFTASSEITELFDFLKMNLNPFITRKFKKI